MSGRALPPGAAGAINLGLLWLGFALANAGSAGMMLSKLIDAWRSLALE